VQTEGLYITRGLIAQKTRYNTCYIIKLQVILKFQFRTKTPVRTEKKTNKSLCAPATFARKNLGDVDTY